MLPRRRWIMHATVRGMAAHDIFNATFMLLPASNASRGFPRAPRLHWRATVGGAAMNILQAIDDPKVFGQHFRHPKSWMAWRAFLAAVFGLKMNAQQRQIFRQCTGR